MTCLVFSKLLYDSNVCGIRERIIEISNCNGGALYTAHNIEHTFAKSSANSAFITLLNAECIRSHIRGEL